MKKISIIVLICSFVVCLFPLLCMLTAHFVTLLFGCSLNEAELSTCPTIFGDAGALLYNMSIVGWVFFYSVPIGFGGLTLGVVLLAIARKRAQKSE